MNKHAIKSTDSTNLMFCKLQARFEDDGYSFNITPSDYSEAECRAMGWTDTDIALWHGIEVNITSPYNPNLDEDIEDTMYDESIHISDDWDINEENIA